MALESKLEKIKLLILDVDGVLTDGKIVIGNDGEEFKFFNVKDGLGIKNVKKLGIKVAIITSKQSKIVEVRMKSLGITDVFQGQKNKVSSYKKLLEKYSLSPEEVGYMGDDLPDLPLLDRSGCAFIPKDANKLLCKYADYQCNTRGGEGAVREVCDLICEVSGFNLKIENAYLTDGELV